MSKVIIKKIWGCLSEQLTTDDKGNTWVTSDLIARSKDLEIKTISMDFLSIDFKIGNMPVREFVGHMKMILEAEMKYPIILDENACVFDGRHRVARALLEEYEEIRAVRFQEDPPPTFIKDVKE